MARTRTVKTDKGLYRIQSKDLSIQKMGLPERDSPLVEINLRKIIIIRSGM